MVCMYVFSVESLRIFHLPRYSEICWQCLGWIFCHSCAGCLVDPDSGPSVLRNVLVLILWSFAPVMVKPQPFYYAPTLWVKISGRAHWRWMAQLCFTTYETSSCGRGWWVLRWLELAGMLSWDRMSEALALAWLLGSSPYGICWAEVSTMISSLAWTGMSGISDYWLSMPSLHFVATAWQSQGSQTFDTLACSPYSKCS